MDYLHLAIGIDVCRDGTNEISRDTHTKCV